MSVLITIFWFAGSAAWAAGLPGLKDDTGPDTFTDNSILCKGILLCDVDKEPNYATLKVSIVSQFLYSILLEHVLILRVRTSLCVYRICYLLYIAHVKTQVVTVKRLLSSRFRKCLHSLLPVVVTSLEQVVNTLQQG
jgi:hypothetical protein